MPEVIKRVLWFYVCGGEWKVKETVEPLVRWQDGDRQQGEGRTAYFLCFISQKEIAAQLVRNGTVDSRQEMWIKIGKELSRGDFVILNEFKFGTGRCHLRTTS